MALTTYMRVLAGLRLRHPAPAAAVPVLGDVLPDRRAFPGGCGGSSRSTPLYRGGRAVPRAHHRRGHLGLRCLGGLPGRDGRWSGWSVVGRRLDKLLLHMSQPCGCVAGLTRCDPVALRAFARRLSVDVDEPLPCWRSTLELVAAGSTPARSGPAVESRRGRRARHIGAHGLRGRWLVNAAHGPTGPCADRPPTAGTGPRRRRPDPASSRPRTATERRDPRRDLG